MDHAASDRAWCILSILVMIGAGLFLVKAVKATPRQHGLQWKINQLKEQIQRSDNRRAEVTPVVLTIPRNTEGSMTHCLFKADASPIRWVSIGNGQLTADRCFIDFDAAYVRFLCPASARDIAEACAASVR